MIRRWRFVNECSDRRIRTLMQASFRLGYFPRSFKHTTTVVLRKPNKSKVKAYRPVALENTLGNIMESVVAEIICYLTETYKLLPAYHFGGRPKCRRHNDDLIRKHLQGMERE